MYEYKIGGIEEWNVGEKKDKRNRVYGQEFQKRVCVTVTAC